jgi:hypothetical protein
MDLALNAQPASGLRGFDMGEGSGSRKGWQGIENAKEIAPPWFGPSP